MQSSLPSYAHFNIVDIHVVLNSAVRLSGWLDATVCKPGSAICMLQPRRLAIVACMALDLPSRISSTPPLAINTLYTHSIV